MQADASEYNADFEMKEAFRAYLKEGQVEERLNVPGNRGDNYD